MLVSLVSGLGLGLLAHSALEGSRVLDLVVANAVDPIGQIFLRLLFVLVIPLVVSALALSVAELGDLRRIGRVGLLTLGYAVSVSAIAVGIGVGLVNWIEPGSGLSPELRERLLAGAAAPPAAASGSQTGVGFLVNLVPSNAVRAMAEGDMLALMIFALLLGVGLALTEGEPARRFAEVLRGLQDVSMRLLGLVIRLAPIGVACLVFSLASRLGIELFEKLAAYVAVVVVGLAIQMFGVYALSVRWLGGISARSFYRGVRTVMVTAFSTASSNATLPTALHAAEHELRLPRPISRFVLTIGSTANQNGTALFEGVTVLFLAQFYGVELTLAQQLGVAGICVLGGIGTAGVPAGSLPVIAMILGQLGIPPEGLGVVLGVDRFLDMCRTAVNVTGDLAAAVVISRAAGSAAK
jgi:DAACS family dicarboxylate/amino acid:cation (Na+ or H+) symporter